MKVHFDVYGRRPLGRLLGGVLERLERFAATRPTSVSLSSRHGRQDLPREELLRTAATSPFEVCTIDTPVGEVIAVWKYGPGTSVPTVFGSVDVAPEGLEEMASCLVDLSMHVGASYAVCDLDGTAFSPSDGIDTYVSRGIFFDLFWWNYFGPEHAGALALNDRIASGVARTEVLSNGGIVVVTRGSPTTPVDKQKVQAIAAEWPVFLKWNAKAESRRIDYSEIRSLPAAPVSLERKIADFVGPADEFIVSVPEKARRFMEWAAAKGIPPKTEEDFRRLFRENRSVIRDEFLVPAIAAYGEAVRQTINGEWTKARWFAHGEPVVGRVGRPWTRRRVIYEVLEALEEGISSI